MLARRRRQPQQRSRLSWRTLAFEVFVVVLGVTLALGANEIRQHFAEQRRVASALESIAAELRQNCEEFERALVYRRSLHAEVDSLEAAGTDLRLESFGTAVNTLSTWRGYNPALATLAAYETARATGALELMTYERALALGSYYAYVELYNQTMRDALGAVMASPGELSFRQVDVAFGIMLDLETQLEPQSCRSAEELWRELGREASGDRSGEESASSPPDSVAAVS